MTVPYYDPEETLTQRTRRQRGDCERLIKWYFPQAEHRMAIWVCWQVSQMQPLAFHRNGGNGLGLFDIDAFKVGLKPEDAWRLHNPIINVAAAHKLWTEHGWAAWQVPPLPDVKSTFGEDKGE